MSQINTEGRRLALVVGDPNGIGPEIALRAALALVQEVPGARPVLVGDAHVIHATARTLALPSPWQDNIEIHDVQGISPEAWQPGVISAAAGAATVAYVRAAIELAQQGKVHAIAAAPHCETAVNAAGIVFSGYSGLVADLTQTPAEQACLMLEAQGLRVVHTTVHERLADALERLTPQLVAQAARSAVMTLQRMGLDNPSVCLLGINPHAGEGGLFGADDQRVNEPAAALLRAEGLVVHGPIGADLALAERRYDVYVAMYHDQGHIAVKMLSPKGATAIVAGVPVLFASVGHGAAFDIAGKGCADASALIATVKTLVQMQ